MTSENIIDSEIIIIGSGISGISSALALLRKGFKDFIILEKAESFGGVWRENIYPGVACDIPSILYQFREDKNLDWSKLYVEGAEILQYLKDMQNKHKLVDKIHYGVEVSDTEYVKEKRIWRVSNSRGELLKCRYLIKATGAFNSPKIPDFPGMKEYSGEIFHTARWPRNLDLRGKRVAVVGTGASAIQLVPIVAKTAEQLTVFQRTPIWLLPKIDLKIPAFVRWGLKNIPGMHESYHRLTYNSIGHFLSVILVSSGKHPRLHRILESVGRWNIRRQLKRPELIKKFMPSYSLGCKRPSFSNNYYRTFERPNVNLNTQGVERLTREGILAKGEEHSDRFDVIVLATGFNILGDASTCLPAFPIKGRDGLDLREYWHQKEGLKAYRGAAVAGFPNLFLNLGIPYAGGTSWYETADMISAQIAECIQIAKFRNCEEIEVKESAVDKYMKDMDNQLAWSIHQTGSCSSSNSYYYDERGNNPIYSAESPEETWAQAVSSVDKCYQFRAAEISEDLCC